MKFAFIDTEKAHMCLSRLCAFAGVSISGCYAWKHRGPSSHQLNNMIILAHIRNQFALSRKTSGSPRMHVEINEDGIRVGRHRTARLMRENGLKARQKMRFKRTTDSHHGEPVAPNLLDQDFTCDVTGVASAPSPPRPMFCGWFRPRHNCKTGLRGLLSVIHKDPVKLRVALLAADPPDNTATQPIPFSRTEFCSARCLNCEKSPMRTLSNYRQEWFSNIRGDVFSGIVVALALIPEAIGFSVIAGVDPKVGLYASFAIACVAAFVGGRPGMISAATAATAVVMISLVKEHGLQYLFASTILMGVIQIVAGWMRLGRVMRFVSRSVITGFVNALAILILMAQLPELIGVPTLTYVMIAGGLAIIYLFPYVTKAIPSPLVAIAVLTAMAWWFGMDLRTVGDLGELPSSIPYLMLPQIPLTWETLQIIFPYSVTLAAVGLLESLLTAQIVDDMTDTPSNKSQECVGQGAGNIASALIGGMGGCAMIGQSVINVTSGGRGRLSTFVAGAFLLFLIVVLNDLVQIIPMAALVAVMIMVSVGTFSWRSILDLRRHPLPSSVVMLATVITVVATHDLAKGVIVGVLLSGIFFAGKVARLFRVTRLEKTEQNSVTYAVVGQVFFASAEAFIHAFDFTDKGKRIIIDLTKAHLWDITAIGALDKIVLKFRQAGDEVEILGFNEASADMIDRFALHDKDERLAASASLH